MHSAKDCIRLSFSESNRGACFIRFYVKITFMEGEVARAFIFESGLNHQRAEGLLDDNEFTRVRSHERRDGHVFTKKNSRPDGFFRRLG